MTILEILTLIKTSPFLQIIVRALECCDSSSLQWNYLCGKPSHCFSWGWSYGKVLDKHRCIQCNITALNPGHYTASTWDYSLLSEEMNTLVYFKGGTITSSLLHKILLQVVTVDLGSTENNCLIHLVFLDGLGQHTPFRILIASDHISWITQINNKHRISIWNCQEHT